MFLFSEEESEIGGEFRVTNQEYVTAYGNNDSPEFKAKALEMEETVGSLGMQPFHDKPITIDLFFPQLSDSYLNSDIGDSFISATVEQISSGSVRIKFKCKFKKEKLEK